MGPCLSCCVVNSGTESIAKGLDPGDRKSKIIELPSAQNKQHQQVASSKTTGSPSAENTHRSLNIKPVNVPDFVEVERFSSTEESWSEDGIGVRNSERSIKTNDILNLNITCPLATTVERERFLIAKDGNYDLAFKQLSSYLEWREKYDICSMTALTRKDVDYIPIDYSGTASENELSTDEIDWLIASCVALSYYKPQGTSKKPEVDIEVMEKPTVLPRLAQIVHEPKKIDKPLRTVDGEKIIEILPAQIDPDIADGETYSLAIAFYLERKLSRESMEMVMICIDMRSGDNWYNPKAKTLIPFIKHISSCLGTNFPERLSKLILFPMPTMAMALWKVVKKFLDPNTAKKIVVIGGTATRDSSPPAKLQKHLPKNIIDQMEKARKDACKYTGSKVKSVELNYWA